MSASAPVSVRFAVMLVALLFGVSSCRFMPSGRAQGMSRLSSPGTKASVLVIITNPDSPSARHATGALVAASARPGERVLILSALGGAILASSQAPASPGIQVPAPPAPLSPYATSFQKARHRQAIRQYQSTLLHARDTLHEQQLRALAAWAKSTIAEAGSRPILQRSENVSIGADLGAAVADLSSLRQAGIGAVNTVIVIADGASVIARSAPSPLAGLQASTVVVDNFPGTTDEEFAWQASLVQSGAARAVVLTPATADQLESVVQQGLDGAVTDTLTSVLFGLGQDKLQPAALPQLRQLLHFLTVTYPHATASINGYTDGLPVAGGNLQLSRLRAQKVEAWLVAQGVASWRLQAFGYGDTDPVAPDNPAGQPLDRRVVVVIDPAVSA